MNIAIYGAGSTGCYLGGLLTLAGFHTTLIGRPRIKKAIEDAGGMTLTDFEGQREKLMPQAIITELEDQQFDLVFITLKCHQLPSIKKELAQLNERGSKLVFMQNGLGSLNAVTEILDSQNTLQGITPFNVLSKDNAVFHRGTEGNLIFERCQETEEVAKALADLGFECDLYDDMRPVIYGKLLLNLNNAINALVNLPLKTELEDRSFRKVLAGTMREWLAVSEATGVKMTQYTAVPPKLVPSILSLPNWLFKIIASKMLAIDPEARSSMWEDIQAGRKTEIEFLNGAVVELGEQLNVATPINKGIVQLILQKEKGDDVNAHHLLALGAGS